MKQGACPARQGQAQLEDYGRHVVGRCTITEVVPRFPFQVSVIHPGAKTHTARLLLYLHEP